MLDKEVLSKIISDLKDVCKDTNISEEVIFKESCTYHRGILINQNRIQNKQEQTEAEPTEKQMKHLERNKKLLLKKGISIENIKTKKKATQILKDLWEKE